MVERCLRRLGDEVERFGGTVDKYIGDNVMALFGAPVAHEDDAERAVRAALGMQAAMEEINADAAREYEVDFALRVGLNTGEVLAGAVGDAYTVTGDTVNVAARLQAAGRPGEVTVGERTVRATRDAVEYREIGQLELKGKSEPVPAWEAVGVLTAQPVRRAPAPSRGALRGTRRRARPARCRLQPRRPRGPAPPRHGRRAGRRGQVAAVPGAGERPGASRTRPRAARGTLPALRLGHRVLAAHRGPADGVPDRRRRRGRRRLDEALDPDQRAAGRGAGRARGRARRAQGGAHRAPARPRLPAGRCGRRVGGPGAGARELLLRGAIGDRGDGPAPPAGARVRGHPLGRRRHARPGRVPRAVGARAADDRMPGARRAARSPPQLGRRPAARVVAVPRPAERRADAEPGHVAAARRRAGEATR